MAELQEVKGQSVRSHKNQHIFAAINAGEVRFVATYAVKNGLSTGIQVCEITI